MVGDEDRVIEEDTTKYRAEVQGKRKDVALPQIWAVTLNERYQHTINKEL